ncbi:mitochondrial large subunit ribosomal protein [Babesia caballi]|uniref:Mitochondrial large subunit ribosomal protein n=1 Tax=Babesia caballi TaxID=5871 RepID=A0AAV4LNB1_BABCB|nr:mitochondrial large subunit ribosomal protein [Babesia caballi]
MKQQLRILCESPVRERVGSLEVHGLHVKKIKRWLVQCGWVGSVVGRPSVESPRNPEIWHKWILEAGTYGAWSPLYDGRAPCHLGAVAVLLEETVHGLVAVAAHTHGVAEGEGDVLVVVDAVLVRLQARYTMNLGTNQADVDLDGAVVPRGQQARGGGALARDVEVNELPVVVNHLGPARLAESQPSKNINRWSGSDAANGNTPKLADEGHGLTLGQVAARALHEVRRLKHPLASLEIGRPELAAQRRRVVLELLQLLHSFRYRLAVRVALRGAVVQRHDGVLVQTLADGVDVGAAAVQRHPAVPDVHDLVQVQLAHVGVAGPQNVAVALP